MELKDSGHNLEGYVKYGQCNMYIHNSKNKRKDDESDIDSESQDVAENTPAINEIINAGGINGDIIEEPEGPNGGITEEFTNVPTENLAHNPENTNNAELSKLTDSEESEELMCRIPTYLHHFWIS